MEAGKGETLPLPLSLQGGVPYADWLVGRSANQHTHPAVLCIQLFVCIRALPEIRAPFPVHCEESNNDRQTPRGFVNCRSFTPAYPERQFGTVRKLALLSGRCVIITNAALPTFRKWATIIIIELQRSVTSGFRGRLRQRQ